MKPAPNTLVQFDELPGEEIEFEIGDPRWVMRVSAKQYSDVTTAIIREYSTNAYDSHVMAGHRDPIEITLPSLMDPRFIVRDHGTGMNRDTFKQIYTKFGISDKRNSNDLNGQLGYGSKSGLAYTDTFEVSSVKDGVLTEAVVMRRPDWSIVLKVVAQSKTDKPNGTAITFIINNVEEFNHKAAEFYKFWLPGRVLLNGAPAAHYVGSKITDNLYYSKDWNTSYVVMGNVPYRIANPDALFRNAKMNRLSFVAYVDDFKTIDGAQPVEFTPSREDLEYSDRTKNTLQAIVHQFEKDILTKAKAEIDSAKDHAEAYERWTHWTDMLGNSLFDDLTFNGDKFKSNFTVYGKRWGCFEHRNSVVTIRDWNVEAMERTMVVTDFGIDVSYGVKQKLKEYFELQNFAEKPKYVIFGVKLDKTTSPWVSWDKIHQVSWEDVKAAIPKKVRVPGTSYNPNQGRLRGSWDYFTKDAVHREETMPADVDEIYYITVQKEKRYNVSGILGAANSDAVVLLVPGNRLAKLTREHPEIKEFVTAFRDKVVQKGSLLLCKDAKNALNIPPSVLNWARVLDHTKIDDPEFDNILKLTNDKTKLIAEYAQNNRLAEWMQMGYNYVEKYVPEEDFSLLEKYPLLRQLSAGGIIHEHVYWYLNAVHAAELEKSNA